MEQSPGQPTIKDVTSPAPSSISVNDAKKKCNLSFYFNFDFDDINSDVSSDSETADLQIDVSEVDNYVPPNKHKRDAIEETSSVINEMEEEIERQLDAKAAKTNLTATNVKNIIKHVITNEYVMAMVKNRLQDTEDDILFEPKLTRAKAKELAAAQVNIPWPITRVTQPTSEVQVLIEEELPEDSSDEEYNPEQDKQSDDEREVEISTNTDVDSLSSTPANNCDSISIELPKSPKIQYDPEGIFKIPCIPHVPTEEENIGQRTRSKLCLSETPLEQIEQAFIPPDITTDMYDWDCEIDEDWDNFLKEFTQPLTQEPVVEDDPEADPEYNILEDEETEFLDKEELRADKAVKVTRKELNNLIAELFEFTDTFSKQEQEISKKRKSPENLNSTIENNSLACSITHLLPIYKEPEVPELMNANQRQLLAVQMCQHVQLMVQHFAMTYKHPELHFESKTCKQNLMSIKNLSNGPNSAFNAANVVDALKLASDWENKFLDNRFSEDFKKTVLDENTVNEIYSSNRWKYIPKFHPELKKLFMESKALMYPQLLPELPFKSGLNKYTRSPYLKSENVLIALGLEQFVPFVATKPRKFKSKKIQLMDALQLMIQYLLPCKEPRGLYNYVQKRRRAKDGNPIRHYFEKGYAPRTIHYIPRECELKAPKEQPIECLPTEWQNYLSNTKQKIDALKRKHILNSYNNLMKKDDCLNGIVKTYTTVPIIHPLRNPIVNMFPKILPTPMNKKNSNKQTIKNTSYMTENVNSENSARASSNELNTRSCSSDVVNTEQTSQRTNPLKSATHVEGKTKPLGKNKEGEDSRNDEITISTTSKHSKFSKKSSGVVQELPELNIYSENSAEASCNELNTGSCSYDVVNTEQTSQHTNRLKSATHVEGKTKPLEKNEEGEDSWKDEITISTTSKHSKFSKKSSGVVQELPELNIYSENSAKASSNELNTGSCSSDVVNTEQTSQRSNPLKSATHIEGKKESLQKNEEEEDSRNDEITISTASKHSKLSKKSSGVVQELQELNVISKNSAEASSNELNTGSCSSDVVNAEQIPQRTNPLKSAMHVEGKKRPLGKNEEEEDNRNDEITISTTSKHSKFSKKSSGVVQELPQLRRTTPRLAKTRSAQNMKLMAQVLGSKGLSSSCNNLKSREKNDMDKSFEKTQSLPKLDNEDEIAELMLASTTIKKDSLSRKKAKEAREIETIKRLLESENPLNEEERGSKFAASYLQKLHLTLESNNHDLFRSVVKLYLDYYEKLDSINQMESELSFSNESGAPQNENIMEQTARDKDAIAINLYQDVCEKLHEYPELCTDFLLFLKPHQAAIMDKSVEYIMLQKMSEFINVAQIYFTKQPSRIAKMMQAITQLSSDPETTLEHVHSIMGPVLKGHPLVMDLFLQVLPTAKPPESLFASHMFENLTCPVGPHDKNKLYTEDAPELYENIELPLSGSQEDPYGGENCRCNCHNEDDMICKSISEHCVSCGTRFLNGKIYLQTSEGLRPAKIIFPGAVEEKLENIARVSLKTADKFVSPIPSRPRRKSSKNESNSDEQYQKPCVSKSSPVKDNEEIGKVIVKSKRNIKSPSKTDQKRGLKRLENADRMDVNAKRVRLTQYKSKKEKKVDKQTKLECTDSHIHHAKLDESSSINTTTEMKKKVLSDGEGEISNDSANKTDSSDDVKISNTNVNIKLWTRQEDMILLQAIKKEYSDNSLVMVSKTLDRTIQQVKERCETLLALLQKMM